MRYLVLIVLFITIKVKADYCFTSFEDDTARASKVFIGKIVEIKKETYWVYNAPRDVVNFRIYKSFKGFKGSEEIFSVITPVGGCCSPRFVLDSTFLVFAYRNEFIYTNDCSNTRLLSQSEEDIEQLGKPVLHPSLNKKTFHIETERDSVQYYKLRVNDLKTSRRSWVGGLGLAFLIVLVFLFFRIFK